MTKVLQAAEQAEASASQAHEKAAASQIACHNSMQPSGIIFDSAPAVLDPVIATRFASSSFTPWAQNAPHY